MLNTNYRSCRTIDPIPITVLVSILLIFVTKHTHLSALLTKAIPSLTGHIGYTYTLMDNTSEINKYNLLKNTLKILNVRNNKVTSNSIRVDLFPSNGTFRINNLSSSDSGKYTLQTFDSDGRSSGGWTLQLFIQGKCWEIKPLIDFW
uniref:Immunoglobulin V-set domain-containing protein n=1 Tax=Haplochromis burtoni TaxID=8153 RepID=A0A3Q2WBY9_HAPBU